MLPRLPERLQTRVSACVLAVVGGTVFLAALSALPVAGAFRSETTLSSSAFIIGASVLLTALLWPGEDRRAGRLVFRALVITGVPIAVLGGWAGYGLFPLGPGGPGLEDLPRLALLVLLSALVGLLTATLRTAGLVWIVPVALTLLFRNVERSGGQSGDQSGFRRE